MVLVMWLIAISNAAALVGPEISETTPESAHHKGEGYDLLAAMQLAQAPRFSSQGVLMGFIMPDGSLQISWLVVV